MYLPTTRTRTADTVTVRMYQGVRNATNGVLPSRASRAMPPPSPRNTANTKIPTMSKLAAPGLRAMIAPSTAPTPVVSKASQSGVDTAMLGRSVIRASAPESAAAAHPADPVRGTHDRQRNATGRVTAVAEGLLSAVAQLALGGALGTLARPAFP